MTRILAHRKITPFGDGWRFSVDGEKERTYIGYNRVQAEYKYRREFNLRVEEIEFYEKTYNLHS